MPIHFALLLLLGTELGPGGLLRHSPSKARRDHLVAALNCRALTRQTSGFLEALDGLFQAAKRKARGYACFDTMRTVIFLIVGKLDISTANPHVA